MQAPRVLFGRGAIAHLGVEAEALGDRILYICTPSLKDSPAADRVRELLRSRLGAEFNGVAQHVPRESAEAACALAAESNANAVIAMGGGSAIGVGKAVAISPSPYGGGSRRGLPLIAIPTTYAGSEMTSVFGMTDRVEGRKHVQRDPAALPRLALYDPELTLDLSPELTASTAMNALAHCVEATYASDVNPVVPPVALEGIRRIDRALPRCVANGRDIDAREELMLGAYLAAFSIANASMGLHHGVCHVLGGRTGVAHGVLNAIMLPHVMRFNADADSGGMVAIAKAMGAGDDARDPGAAAALTAALLASLPLRTRLRDVGIERDQFPEIAAEAVANASVRNNPKPVTESDVRQVLSAAW